MPQKPNYDFQRAERDRAKKASKELKQQQKKEQAARKKAGLDDPAPDAEQPKD